MDLCSVLALQALCLWASFALMKDWAGILRAAVSWVGREGASDMGSDGPG